jgi:hypothetical protein
MEEGSLAAAGAGNFSTLVGLEEKLYELYDYAVMVYIRPKHLGHVVVTWASFFVMSELRTQAHFDRWTV